MYQAKVEWRLQSCSWTETADQSDRFVIKSFKSSYLIKQQLSDKLEAQTRIKVSARTFQRRLKERHLWRKKSKKLCVSENNRLPQLSFPREHIKGSIDKWECVVLNSIKNLWG